MITVRNAQEGDEEALLKLLGQVLLVHHKARPDLFQEVGSKHSREDVTKMILDKENPIFVAVDESGEVVGHCMCEFKLKDAPNLVYHKELHIDDLCIDENHRSLGIGRLLCEHAINYAKEIGCYDVTLDVWEGNDSAKAFYENFGFNPYKYGMEIIL